MTSDQLERITINQSILGGKPCVRGTRISVEQVLDHLAAGWTSAEIVQNYPSLKVVDIVACLAYARDVVAGEALFPSAA